MIKKRFFFDILAYPFILYFKFFKKKNKLFEKPNSFIIYWPLRDLGLLFSIKYLLSTIKEIYPQASVILVVRKSVMSKIEESLLKKLIGLSSDDKIFNYSNFISILKKKDVSIVISVKEFNFLPHLFGSLNGSKFKIGVTEIDTIINPFKPIFDIGISFKWNENPDVHITELMLKLAENLDLKIKQDVNKITPKELSSIREIGGMQFSVPLEHTVILLNNQPENVSNRWGIENLVKFTDLLVNSGKYFFFFIEDQMEKEVKDLLEKDIGVINFVNKNDIVQILNVLKICDLVITCSSDIMHLAGLVDVPQLSIFGLENPFNYSPIGENKKFIAKPSGLIDDVTGEDVFNMSQQILNKK